MRTCLKCNKETMEYIDLLNSISRARRFYKAGKHVEGYSKLPWITSSSSKYDICRPCGEVEYAEEKSWEEGDVD